VREPEVGDVWPGTIRRTATPARPRRSATAEGGWPSPAGVHGDAPAEKADDPRFRHASGGVRAAPDTVLLEAQGQARPRSASPEPRVGRASGVADALAGRQPKTLHSSPRTPLGRLPAPRPAEGEPKPVAPSHGERSLGLIPSRHGGQRGPESSVDDVEGDVVPDSTTTRSMPRDRQRVHAIWRKMREERSRLLDRADTLLSAQPVQDSRRLLRNGDVQPTHGVMPEFREEPMNSR